MIPKSHYKPSKRTIELATARIAGYHNDSETYTKLICERRSASYDALQDSWRAGFAAKANGMKCGCNACSNTPVEEIPC